MRKITKDYTGNIYGCWEVIERDLHPTSKSHETFWIARCQNCGNIASVRKTDLDKKPQTCNKCKGTLISQILKEKGYTVYPINIGDRFGLLTVLDTPFLKQGDKNHQYVKCQCDCGNIIEVRKDHLLGLYHHSKTISCGCINKSSGEIKIEQLLIKNNVNFQSQYRIKEFNNASPFDFAIFDDNNQLIKLIEFDGEQHFQAINHFGGEDKFKLQQKRDKQKDIWCQQQGIKLQRIPYYDYDKITIDYLLS